MYNIGDIVYIKSDLGTRSFSVEYINSQTNYFYEFFYDTKEIRKLKLEKFGHEI